MDLGERVVRGRTVVSECRGCRLVVGGEWVVEARGSGASGSWLGMVGADLVGGQTVAAEFIGLALELRACDGWLEWWPTRLGGIEQAVRDRDGSEIVNRAKVATLAAHSAARAAGEGLGRCRDRMLDRACEAVGYASHATDDIDTQFPIEGGWFLNWPCGWLPEGAYCSECGSLLGPGGWALLAGRDPKEVQWPEAPPTEKSERND